MAGAPIGAVVRLYVDLREHVAPGDAIATETGRRYLVIGARVQQRGKRAGRQHLVCVVADPLAIDGARLHTIRWYKRRKRSA